MKNLSFLFLSLIIASVSKAQLAQPNLKFMAFERSVVPGIRKVIVAEGGNSPSHSVLKSRGRNIELYLEHSPKIIVKPLFVWIDGETFTLRTEKQKVPVIKTSQGIGQHQKFDTLVKASTNKVWKLVPGSKFQNAEKKTPALASNELIIVYSIRGKRYNSLPIKIEKLSDEILQ